MNDKVVYGRTHAVYISFPRLPSRVKWRIWYILCFAFCRLLLLSFLSCIFIYRGETCRDQGTLSCMHVLKKLACPQNTQTIFIHQLKYCLHSVKQFKKTESYPFSMKSTVLTEMFISRFVSLWRGKMQIRLM